MIFRPPVGVCPLNLVQIYVVNAAKHIRLRRLPISDGEKLLAARNTAESAITYIRIGRRLGLSVAGAG
jgi:hypothetical protein